MKTFTIQPKRSTISTPRALIKAALITLTCTLLVVSGAYAAIISYKISGQLPEGGVVSSRYQISPDGAHVVFTVRTNSGKYNLYSVSTRGENPIQLNRPQVDIKFTIDFKITSDSSRVVYRAYRPTEDGYNLFSVPINGSATPIQLDPASDAGRNINANFEITPDSSGVVYIADEEWNGEYDLYSIPINGGSPIELSAEIPEGWSVFDCQITPDGLWVVFRAIDPDFDYSLMRVPISGGSPLILGDNGDVSNYAISPDSQYVTYTAYDWSSNTTDLYSIPMTGGVLPVQLNPVLVDRGHVKDNYQITPNSQGVVFLADPDVGGRYNLFSVSMDGVTLHKLNETLGENQDVTDFEITSNSLGVVYRDNHGLNSGFNLYSIYINGTNRTPLNPPLESGKDVGEFHLAPNELGVIYRADQDMDEVWELYGVYINGVEPTKLNADFNFWQDVEADFMISPNSQAVVYRADVGMDDVIELYVVPSIGGSSTKLNGETPILEGDVLSFAITPDSLSVVFLGDLVVDYQDELYVAYYAPFIYLPIVTR